MTALFLIVLILNLISYTYLFALTTYLLLLTSYLFPLTTYFLPLTSYLLPLKAISPEIVSQTLSRPSKSIALM